MYRREQLLWPILPGGITKVPEGKEKGSVQTVELE
jgi:hypothetical protein